MKEKGKNTYPHEACIAVEGRGDRQESKTKLKIKRKLHSLPEGIGHWEKIEQGTRLKILVKEGLAIQWSGQAPWEGTSFIEI